MRSLLLCLCVFILTSCFDGSDRVDVERDHFIIRTQSGAQFDFHLEVADTLDKQMNGLMHRTSLGADEGMVFPVEIPRIFNMWMRDTKIPLDMLFVSETGEISHIHWEAQPLSDEVITHAIPAKAVFELQGGIALDKDINPGDFIFHEMFNNLEWVEKQGLPETDLERIIREGQEQEVFRKQSQEEAEIQAQDEWRKSQENKK